MLCSTTGWCMWWLCLHALWLWRLSVWLLPLRLRLGSLWRLCLLPKCFAMWWLRWLRWLRLWLHEPGRRLWNSESAGTK